MVSRKITYPSKADVTTTTLGTFSLGKSGVLGSLILPRRTDISNVSDKIPMRALIQKGRKLIPMPIFMVLSNWDASIIPRTANTIKIMLMMISPFFMARPFLPAERRPGGGRSLPLRAAIYLIKFISFMILTKKVFCSSHNLAVWALFRYSGVNIFSLIYFSFQSLFSDNFLMSSS